MRRVRQHRDANLASLIQAIDNSRIRDSNTHSRLPD